MPKKRRTRSSRSSASPCRNTVSQQEGRMTEGASRRACQAPPAHGGRPPQSSRQAMLPAKTPQGLAFSGGSNMPRATVPVPCTRA